MKPDFEDDDFEEEFEENDLELDGEDNEGWVEEDEEEDEELKGLSEAQKERFRAMQEDREEAIRFASEANARAERNEQALRESHKTVVGEIKSGAEKEIAEIKRQLTEAIEIDDAEKQVELNEKLAEAIQKRRLAAAAEEEVSRPVTKPTETNEVPAIRKQWYAKNKWFDLTGEAEEGDEIMTAAAIAIHGKLVRSGVKPDTPEYFEKINRRMADVFPEKMSVKRSDRGEKPERRGKPAKGGPAPMSRRPSGNRRTIVMTDSMRRIARSLNLTDKEYLQSYAKYDAKYDKEEDNG